MMSEEIQEIGQDQESEQGPIYITRGMKSECSCGTAPKGNYLNIVVDHGVLVGEQPLLNANDHTSDTIVGYGNCTSSTNPELQAKKGISDFLLGGSPLNFIVKTITGKSATDILMDIGLVGCKCKPDTPLVWDGCDEDHILDGAPVLTLKSKLYCRKGGYIEVMDPAKQEALDGKKESDGKSEESDDEVDIVDDAAKEALAAAMAKISAATPEGSGSDSGGENASDGQNGGGQNATSGNGGTSSMASVGMMAMAAMSVLPANQAGRVMPALGLGDGALYTAVGSTPEQRFENLTYNQQLSLPAEALNSQGLIQDISKLDAFKFQHTTVSSAGNATVTAYNTIKLLSPQKNINFADVIYGMEAYGMVQTQSGCFTPGIADFMVKQGYGIEYLMPNEILPTTKRSVIGMSLNEGLLNYRATKPANIEDKADQFSLMVMHKKMEE